MGSWTPHSRALHNDCALQRDGGFLYGSREWPGQHVCNGKTLLKGLCAGTIHGSASYRRSLLLPLLQEQRCSTYIL